MRVLPIQLNLQERLTTEQEKIIVNLIGYHENLEFIENEYGISLEVLSQIHMKYEPYILELMKLKKRDSACVEVFREVIDINLEYIGQNKAISNLPLDDDYVNKINKMTDKMLKIQENMAKISDYKLKIVNSLMNEINNSKRLELNESGEIADYTDADNNREVTDDKLLKYIDR